MRLLITFFTLLLSINSFAQNAHNPNVIVVPFVTTGDDEGDRIKDLIENDPAVTLAMSKIK